MKIIPDENKADIDACEANLGENRTVTQIGKGNGTLEVTK